eukprot:CAMPEP_0119272444 /NCGR_PEP_ID=MMETSP1329-20130426/8619_1 /TAXON_ID=114041 /ORGANISM="Genus nov. species nov., Strain RCC1024" /LENGTH=278 /DNA_ID=CAMNT_0007272511 /DNA_START=177 /DNA_END=1009 /DNA_ORIENTATION=-
MLWVTAALALVLGLGRAEPVESNEKLKRMVHDWLFSRSSAEAKYGHIAGWDTSRITDFSEVFCTVPFCESYHPSAEEFNDDISAWNTSSAVTMRLMFRGASRFDRPIGRWDVSHVQNFDYMFRGASDFDQDIGSWDTRSLTSMVQMFFGSRFNQDLSRWDVASVIDMREAFSFALRFDQLLGWCIPNNVEARDAFYQTACEKTECGIVCRDGGSGKKKGRQHSLTVMLMIQFGMLMTAGISFCGLACIGLYLYCERSRESVVVHIKTDGNSLIIPEPA